MNLCSRCPLPISDTFGTEKPVEIIISIKDLTNYNLLLNQKLWKLLWEIERNPKRKNNKRYYPQNKYKDVNKDDN